MTAAANRIRGLCSPFSVKNQKWDRLRNGTPGSLPIFGQSTSNNDQIVAHMKPGLYAYGKTIALEM